MDFSGVAASPLMGWGSDLTPSVLKTSGGSSSLWSAVSDLSRLKKAQGLSQILDRADAYPKVDTGFYSGEGTSKNTVTFGVNVDINV